MTELDKIASECLGAFDEGLSAARKGYSRGLSDFERAVASGALKSTSTAGDLDRVSMEYARRALGGMSEMYVEGYNSAFLTSALNSTLLPPSAISSDVRTGYVAGLADFKQAIASGDLGPDNMAASDLKYVSRKYADRARGGKSKTYMDGYKCAFLASALFTYVAALGWSERLSNSLLDVLVRPYGPLPLWGWGFVGASAMAVGYFLILRKAK